MKELSIEEKAKRYNEAINIAKSKIKNDKNHVLYEDDVIEIFPELKENEDESIRKALLEIVNDTKGDDLWINYNVHKEEVAAWLEKQTDNRVNLLEVKGHTYSGVTFKYNGHIWGMCARDGGVEILVDGEIKERVFLDNEPENKSAIEISEDESIRKWIIEYFQEYKSTGIQAFANGLKIDSIIAWLERQVYNKDIHLLELKAKAYDDAKERMSYAYNQNRVPIGFISEIFPNLNSYENQSKTPITQYCCILDFNTGEVFKHCITEDEVNLTSNELLYKLGFNADECSIMYTSNNLELKLLEN